MIRKNSAGFILGLLLVMTDVVSANPGQAKLDLGRYTLTETHYLPPGDFTVNPAIINAHEVSAITYNWDSGTLFVVGDEGGVILEIDDEGNALSQMAIIGFNDPEGLTYTGNNTFVIAEERNRDVYEISYNAGGFVIKTVLNGIDLGPFVDNIGIEGVAYDPISNEYLTVKEKLPQEVNINLLDFPTQSAVINPLFVPALGVSDIADIYVIRTLSEFQSAPFADNLLIISQESQLILEVDRSGNILSQFSLNGIASTAEGLTMGPDGTIYFTAENGNEPQMFVLSPTVNTDDDEDIPLPLWSLIILAALIGFSGSRSSKA